MAALLLSHVHVLDAVDRQSYPAAKSNHLISVAPFQAYERLTKQQSFALILRRWFIVQKRLSW